MVKELPKLDESGSVIPLDAQLLSSSADNYQEILLIITFQLMDGREMMS